MNNEMIQFLRENEGNDLINVAYEFRIKFNLTDIEAGKLIIQWQTEDSND